jgi:ribose transport system permease protein
MKKSTAGESIQLKKGGSVTRLQKLYESSSVFGQILSLLIVIFIFTAGTKGQYLSWNNCKTILGLAGIPMIICLGAHLVIVMGAMDLSVEGIIALCAVVSGFLIKNPVTGYNIGFWIFPVVILIGGIAGFANGIINTKLKIPSFISTLGISWVAFGLAVILSGGLSIPLKDPRFQILSNGSFLGFPNIIWIAVFLFFILYVFQKKTFVGKHMYAIGGDEVLAKQAGVNVNRIKILVFTVTGVLYGLAALFLVARLNSAAARLGNNLLFPAMTAVAVGGVSLSGGVGGALNALMGTLIVTALNNGLVLMQVNPYAQSAVNGIVLIAAVALTIDRKKIGIIK